VGRSARVRTAVIRFDRLTAGDRRYSQADLGNMATADVSRFGDINE
jgi:hypothetical protein